MSKKQFKKQPQRRGKSNAIRRDNGVSSEMNREVQHKYNDISWYAKNESMLRDAASFSYNNPVGDTFDVLSLIVPTGSAVISDTAAQSLPGVMNLNFIPTIGLSTSSTSPANLAAQNIYSYVRYMNSGAKNYDQADLMLYLLSMDSIYMMWNWAKRMYGYARTYSQKNRYYPRGFARGDNLSTAGFIDLINNLADFRFGLNQLAAQISSFCVPAVMPLFIRHSWMASNIYKDSDVSKAQMYMFHPHGYYTYNETASEYGGKLVFTVTPQITSYKQVINIIQSMLDAVAYSEDIGVMSGDILKAYGQGQLFKMTPIDPDYQVEPVYNEEVLNQIHNSTCVALESASGNMDITQNPDTGFLLWNPTFNPSTQTFAWSKALINMPWEDVTPANTMQGTRLVTLMNTDFMSSTTNIYCCGTEIIHHRDIITFKSDGTFQVNTDRDGFIDVTTSTSGYQTGLVTAALMAEFDWHPLMPMFIRTSDSGVWSYVGIFGDVSNYTRIDNWSMEQLHKTAILSEFNVPQMGSF